MKADRMRRNVFMFGPIALLAATGLPAQIFYVWHTGGTGGAARLSQIPQASSSHLISQMKAMARQPLRSVVVSDTSNFVMAKFASIYINPSSASFPSDDHFSGLVGENNLEFVDALILWMYPNLKSEARSLIAKRTRLHRTAAFQLHSADGSSNAFFLEQTTGGPAYSESKVILISPPSQTILNRRSATESQQASLRPLGAESTRNHLIFVASALGKPSHYLQERDRISIFQLEPDYFFPSGTMAGIGRHFIFNAVNPAPRVRLVVDVTASLNADDINRVPPAVAIGKERRTFHAAGRGSARMFSDGIEPQEIEGRHYIGLDMGTEGGRFPDQRSGVMSLYGKDIPIDPRRIVGFARDISLISEEEYETLKPPTKIEHFPQDLANRDLEYTGIYEDGWIAEATRLTLRKPKGPSVLIVRAKLPAIDAGLKETQIQVLINDTLVHQRSITPGDVNIQLPASIPPGNHRVEVRCDRVQRLNPPDTRLISLRLSAIGFEPARVSEIVDPPVRIGPGWYPFEEFGGETFRWVAKTASLIIDSAAKQSGTLAFEVESGPGMKGHGFDLKVTNGRSSSMLKVKGTRQFLEAPLKLLMGSNRVELHVSGGGASAPGDPRILNFRIFHIDWIPDKK